MSDSNIVETKPVRTEKVIADECSQMIVELGQRSYQKWLLEREIDAAHKKIYALNVEAYKLKAAALEDDGGASNG